MRVRFQFQPIAIALLALFLALFAACLISNPEEEMARASFQAEWEKVFRQCGESYYAIHDGNQIVELKMNPSQWTIEPISLTSADEANGIKWAGFIKVTASLSRYYDQKVNQWSTYRSGLGGLQALLSGNAIFMDSPLFGGIPDPLTFQFVKQNSGEYVIVDASQQYLRVTGKPMSEFWQGKKLLPINDCKKLSSRN